MDSERLVACLRALGDPNRLALFELLCQEQQCNCDMGDKLGLAPNLVSHHLRVLRECGLVVAERHPTDARWVLYSLNRDVVAELAGRMAVLLDATPALAAARSGCGPACALPATEGECACR
ncbi:MAG: ArsR/SmtB family transcription factor [Anaerolineae bacterium]